MHVYISKYNYIAAFGLKCGKEICELVNEYCLCRILAVGGGMI